MIKSNLTYSNLLTFIRIILVPFIILAMFERNWTNASLIFTIAALTDLFDGFLARYLGQETVLGSYLDPLADKILFIGLYVSLIFVNFSFWKIPMWFVIFVLFKELLLIIGAIYLGQKNRKIQPSILGKITTALQSVFIFILFMAEIFKSFGLILSCFFYTIFVFMFITLMHYCYLGYMGNNYHD